MTRRFSINFGIAAFVLDAAWIAFALFAANAVRPMMSSLPFVAYFPDPVVPPVLYPVFALTWPLILLFFAVYDGRRSRSFGREWLNLTAGSLLAGVALAGILFLTYRDISRVQFLVFAILAYAGLVAWRVVSNAFLRRRSADRKSRVLIAGSGALAQELGASVQNKPDSPMELAGYVDDSDGPGRLGRLADVRQLVVDRRIDAVVIALPESDHERVADVISDLHSLPVRILVIPNYFQLALFRAGLEEFAGIPMLDLRAPAISEYQRVVKRVLDLIVSVCVLVPGIPLMTLIALAVWAGSGRPVLFRQERVGENGRRFSIYKFRTMVKDAARIPLEAEGHKKQRDPRVTRVGRWLRRTSLDELPQFFNVLKGEMSLVGPRPELPEIVEHYEPWQRQRFTVPPGITGWWQISGRSQRMMHLHTEDDLYYIKHYSLFMDLQILARTLWVVLRGDGAW